MNGLLTRPFVRQASSIYAMQAIGMAAAMLTSVLIARTLGPTGKGAVDLFVLLTSLIAEFGLLGITYGFTYSLANRGRPLAQVHGNAVVAATLLGTSDYPLRPCCLRCARPSGTPSTCRSWSWSWGSAGFLAYSAGWTGLMLGVDQAPLTFRVQAVASGASLAAVGLLVLVGAFSPEAAIGIIAAVAVGGAVLRFSLAKRRHFPAKLAVDRVSFVESLRYGLKQFPGMFANWLHFRIDLLVVSQVVGLAGVGIYAVSVRWAELLWLVGMGVQSAAVHRIASETKEAGYAFTKRVFVVVLLMTSCAGVALALIADPLLRLLYGPEFAPAVVPLILLIPGVVAWDSARVLSNYMAYNRGRPGLTAAIAVAGAASNLVVTLFAVRVWGINGAAVTTSITYSLVLLATLLAFLRIGRTAR